MEQTAPRALLIYPRFHPHSFWNYKASCEIVGARYPTPPLGLITVAALLPAAWEVRLIDRNVEDLTDADIDTADLILTGGMLPQRPDALEIIDRCHRRGKPVVIGGPDVTSSPHIYSHAEFQVRGEAEPVMGQLIEAWNAGARRGVFEAEKFSTDVTTSPPPRFDLLTFGNYLFVNVQYSRGCPFNCEFCDIIELYGRKPRTKTNAQMLAELEALYQQGYRGHVDFVDDNLIGNKKALKQFLPALIAWQRERGYPFEFSTEASINLADDDQLLALMRDANFFGVFIGIESPDTETLVAMQKKQNTRRDLAASITKIYHSGMFVFAGFILGFDSEKGSVARPMIECIEAASIPVCLVGLLYALPHTQLTRRLHKEGRLHAEPDVPFEHWGGDQCTAGLNFETIRPRREILSDFMTVLQSIYHPAAYFARVRAVGRALRRPARGAVPSRQEVARDLARLARFVWIMARKQPKLLPHFMRTFADCARHNPGALKYVTMIMGLYLHLGPFSQIAIGLIARQIAMLDRGEAPAPVLMPATSDPAPRRVAAVA
jgi:hypothetical protein